MGATEATEYLDYSGEYVFRAWVRGHLGPQGQPVKLQMIVDGKPIQMLEVPTAENETTSVARDTQRSNREVRVYLTAGEHVFRAELLGEEFRKPIPLPPAGRRPGAGGGFPPAQPLAVFPEKFDLLGPFPAKGDHPSRTKILLCDPATGPACIQKIVAPLARRAYRRPVTKTEIAALVAVAEKAKATGFTPDQSVQFAIQAMLVSPNFLFRVEADPKGKFGPISDIELASRLSYFLWSSAPDDELLTLAEQKRLRKSGILDQQVTRMLADPKSIALAENFAGQWLEIAKSRCDEAGHPEVPDVEPGPPGRHGNGNPAVL